MVEERAPLPHSRRGRDPARDVPLGRLDRFGEGESQGESGRDRGRERAPGSVYVSDGNPRHRVPHEEVAVEEDVGRRAFDQRPEFFQQFLGELPENVVLVTTLETNRDEGYEKVSKAPLPSWRYAQFAALEYPRKVVTIEPVMDFDFHRFCDMIEYLRPEYVWVGFNSHPKSVDLPEPSVETVRMFIAALGQGGISVREKDMR